VRGSARVSGSVRGSVRGSGSVRVSGSVRGKSGVEPPQGRHWHDRGAVGDERRDGRERNVQENALLGKIGQKGREPRQKRPVPISSRYFLRFVWEFFFFFFFFSDYSVVEKLKFESELTGIFFFFFLAFFGPRWDN
jgi:hypothetical protein